MHPKPPSQNERPASGEQFPDDALVVSVDPPVLARARNHQAGHVIKRHRHDRDQLLYAIRGVMTIQAMDSLWTVPPSFGLLIPAGVGHALRMDTDVEMRTLYFRPGLLPVPDGQCQLRSVSPLLRELIVRATHIEPPYAPDSAQARIMQVIVDEVGAQQTFALSLRMPSDKRLLDLCQHVLKHMDQSESVRQLGHRVGLSERSILRLFPQQTGVTFQTWRQQARLMRAFVLAEAQWPLKTIASELGYSSSAAFAKMFRKVFGCAPRAMLRWPRGSAN
jgi:AraC-like DNA-binding protein